MFGDANLPSEESKHRDFNTSVGQGRAGVARKPSLP